MEVTKGFAAQKSTAWPDTTFLEKESLCIYFETVASLGSHKSGWLLALRLRPCA